jgi:CBS domain containing-hemolysin-like protein
MIATQPSFPPSQRTLLEGALEITERRLREVLVSRREVLVGELYDESTTTSAPSGATRWRLGPARDLPAPRPARPRGRPSRGPYATVAGLALDRLGRIPEGGETVTVDDWSLELMEVDRHTIERLRLRPHEQPPDG